MEKATHQLATQTSTSVLRNYIPLIILLIVLTTSTTSNYHPPLSVTNEVKTSPLCSIALAKLRRCKAKKVRRNKHHDIELNDDEDYTNQIIFLVLLLLTISQIAVFFFLEYKLFYGPFMRS
jgi:hypothetical protein